MNLTFAVAAAIVCENHFLDLMCYLPTDPVFFFAIVTGICTSTDGHGYNGRILP